MQYATWCFPGLCQIAEETMNYFVSQSLLDCVKVKVHLSQNCPNVSLQQRYMF